MKKIKCTTPATATVTVSDETKETIGKFIEKCDNIVSLDELWKDEKPKKN